VEPVHETRPDERAREAEPPAPAATPLPRLLAGPERVLALQRTAGNRAVSAMLARDTPPGAPSGTPGGATAAPAGPRVNYIFLMGKGDAFYGGAKAYLEKAYGQKAIEKTTLAEVIEYVNAQGKPVGQLLLVSHATEEGNLGFSLDAADKAGDKKKADGKERLEFGELKKANDAGSLPKADVKLIDAQTQVIVKGCNIGRSQLMLDELDKAFGGHTSVTAPTHAQEYRTGFGNAPEENLGDYYWEVPGKAGGPGLVHAGVGAAPDPAGAAQSADEVVKAMQGKYPFVKPDQWPGIKKAFKKEVEDYKFKGWEYDPDPDRVFVLAGLNKEWKGWKVEKAREEKGGKYVYTFKGESATAIADRTVELPKPTPRAELIKMAQAVIARPDAYGWGLLEEQLDAGGLKVPHVTLFVQRTQWTAKGTTLEAGKGNRFQPGATDKDYFRTSGYTPPAPPAAPPAKP
jgi:hypothetical protein